MKKKIRKERFLKAYNEELKKQGLLDSEVDLTEETIEEHENITTDMTKADLIDIANKQGIKTNTHMTKADLIKLINNEEV